MGWWRLQAGELAVTKCVILLGGTITATAHLIAQCQGSLVIAADSGIYHAEALGLHVDCWVGDFDSTTPAIAQKFVNVPRKTFPADKDKTDGELAIEEAIARGATRFLLVGAFGGSRTDHALLHNFQALVLARRGFEVKLTNGLEEAFPVLPGTIAIPLVSGTLFSLIGFGPLEGVTIDGAKWPLLDRDVAVGSSLTLSNVALGPISLSIRSGEALFISGSLEAR